MSWVVIDHTAKGGIFPFNPTTVGPRPRTTSSVWQRNLTTSRTGVSSRKKQNQRQEQRQRRGSRVSCGGGGGGDRRATSSMSTRLPRALSTPPNVQDASPEDERSQSSLDCAWAKFGEARVLTQQNCFPAAWRALLEAKCLIDKAAESGSPFCVARHRQALLQLGQELNAATQLWLLQEAPPSVKGLPGSTTLYSDLATTATVRTRQRPLQRVDIDRDAEEETPLRSRDVVSPLTSPECGQHSNAEMNISIDVHSNEANVSLAGDCMNAGGATIRCRVVPTTASRCGPSRTQDMWNLPNLHSVVSQDVPPQIITAYDGSRPKFSDGIIAAAMKKHDKRQLLQCSPMILYSSFCAPDGVNSSQEQPKQNMSCKLQCCPSLENPASEGSKCTAQQATPVEYATSSQNMSNKMDTITIVSSLSSSSSSALPPSPQPQPQPQPQRAAESPTGSCNLERRTIIELEPEVRSILDLGEPSLVPLYTFEVVRPRPKYCNTPQGSFRASLAPHTAPVPINTQLATNRGRPAPAAGASSLRGSSSQALRECTLMRSGSSLQSGTGASTPFSYVSVYNFSQGREGTKSSGCAHAQREVTHDDNVVPHAHDVLEKGHSHDQPCCNQQQREEEEEEEKEEKEEMWNADAVGPVPSNSYMPEDRDIGNSSVIKELSRDVDACASTGCDMQPPVEASLRRCFDGVEGYQEARELHQHIMERLLIERREEEEEEKRTMGHRRAHHSRAVQLLGLLEEAYLDWLVDHLGIKRRPRLGGPVQPQSSPSTPSAMTVDSSRSDKKVELEHKCLKCSSTTQMENTSHSLCSSRSSVRLEAALVFGRAPPRVVTASAAIPPRDGTTVTPPSGRTPLVPSPPGAAPMPRTEMEGVHACDDSISAKEASASASISVDNGVLQVGRAEKLHLHE